MTICHYCKKPCLKRQKITFFTYDSELTVDQSILVEVSHQKCDDENWDRIVKELCVFCKAPNQKGQGGCAKCRRKKNPQYIDYGKSFPTPKNYDSLADYLIIDVRRQHCKKV